MLKFIALNITNILYIILIIIIISAITSGYYAFRRCDEDKSDKFAIIMLSNMVIGAILTLNISRAYPVSNAPWKTIYKNDLNANIQITYNDQSETYTVKTEKPKQNIQKFQSELKEADVFSDVQLTVKKGEDSLTKNVMLENKNFITKNVDLENAHIVKIEYRPLNGQTRKVFGTHGKTKSTNKDGEIRITFESNTNKQLENLFKD